MRWISDGVPELMIAVLPRDEVTFTDGWHVQGLKATGSYDYNVADLFVPAYRTFQLFTREPLRGTAAVGRMGMMAVDRAGHATPVPAARASARASRGAAPARARRWRASRTPWPRSSLFR